MLNKYLIPSYALWISCVFDLIAAPLPNNPVDSTLITVSIPPHQFIQIADSSMVIVPNIVKTGGQAILKGRANNAVETYSNSKIQLQVSLEDSHFLSTDRLTMTLVPSENGLGSTIDLWDGAQEAYQVQIATGISGSAQLHSFFIDYEGSVHTPSQDLTGLITITVFTE